MEGLSHGGGALGGGQVCVRVHVGWEVGTEVFFTFLGASLS